MDKKLFAKLTESMEQMGEITRVDLAHYRAGLPPLKRKEITLGPECFLTKEQMAQKTTSAFKEALKGRKDVK